MTNFEATKGFAQLINHSLLMSQMLRRLDAILQNVDPSSKTIIYIQDAQKASHIIPHEFTVGGLYFFQNYQFTFKHLNLRFFFYYLFFICSILIFRMKYGVEDN